MPEKDLLGLCRYLSYFLEDEKRNIETEEKLPAPGAPYGPFRGQWEISKPSPHVQYWTFRGLRPSQGEALAIGKAKLKEIATSEVKEKLKHWEVRSRAQAGRKQLRNATATLKPSASNGKAKLKQGLKVRSASKKGKRTQKPKRNVSTPQHNIKKKFARVSPCDGRPPRNDPYGAPGGAPGL